MVRLVAPHPLMVVVVVDNLIFRVTRLLGLHGVPPRLHPSEGVGQHHHHQVGTVYSG